MWECGDLNYPPRGGNKYPRLPYIRTGASHIPHDCGAHVLHTLERITKDVAVLDMSLLAGFTSKVVMCGSVGIQPIPQGGEIDTPHSHAEGLQHPTRPTNLIPSP